MRLGELAGLTLTEGQLALKDGMLRVFGKRSRERFVPVGATSQSALRRYVHLHRPESYADALCLGAQRAALTEEGIRQVVRRVARRAGGSGVHPPKVGHN